MTERPAIAVARVDVPTSQNGVRVGLIGHGIQLSRTPRMHMDEGAALGIPYDYKLIDTEMLGADMSIADLLQRAEESGLSGVNVTHPFKRDAIAYIPHLSDAANAVGAVNTVVFRGGERYGHNTDYWGFAEAFRQAMADAPKTYVLLLGAGGAGGAVANALLDNGVAHLAIFDTSPELAEALAVSLAARVGDPRVSVATAFEVELEKADGVVNATPVGMASAPGSPVPADLLRPTLWVADIIYFPLETQLLRDARGAGCRTMDGSGMAVFQAVRAFELFSGVTPDPKRMRATFDTFTLPTAGCPAV